MTIGSNLLLLMICMTGFSYKALGQSNSDICTQKTVNCSGIFREYHQNGKVRFESNWLNGKPAPNRVETYFYTDGRRADVKQFRKNIVEGEYKKFSEEGKLEEKINYRDGKKNGKSSTYDDAGKIKDTTEWLNDEKHGDYIEYGEDGKPTGKIQYKEGMPHGKTISYYDNGNISQVTEYLKGEKDGYEKEMQQNGTPKASRTYRRGKLEGTEKIYDADGNLAQEVIYKNGKRHGISKRFSEDGKIIGSTTYKNDEPVLETDNENGKEDATWMIYPDGSRSKTNSNKKKPVSSDPI